MIFKSPPYLIRRFFPASLVWEMPNNQRNIYLTFDDGPVPEVTPLVLDILNEFDIKATFFMVGENVLRNKDLLQRVVEKGHSVGNHTFNHLKGWKTSDSVYFDNIKKASDLIPGNLFRPPHGQITPNQAKLLISDYQIVMWSVLTEDYNANLSSEEVFKNVATHVKSGSIIVFHDSLKASKNMIPGLRLSIPYLIERGYRFEVLKSHSTLIAQ